MKIILFVRTLGSKQLCKISQESGLLSNFGSLPKIRNASFGHCGPLGIKWEKGDEAALNHHVLVKNLVGVGIHTYIDMLGYCLKDKGEDHFEVMHHNVTNGELEAGLEKCMKFGTSFAKKKVVITSKNLLERCLCYLHFKMHK